MRLRRGARATIFQEGATQVQVLSLRPKIGSRKIPDFSLFISQNLLKSHVFAINIMGLFFPALRVEQAHFSPLSTCLTTYGDFCTISRYKKCKICTFVFARRGKFYSSVLVFSYSCITILIAFKNGRKPLKSIVL